MHGMLVEPVRWRAYLSEGRENHRELRHEVYAGVHVVEVCHDGPRDEPHVHW